MTKLYPGLLANYFSKVSLILALLFSANVFIARSQTGVLDVTFGNKGKVTTPLSGNAEALGLALQADGKIVALAKTKTQIRDTSAFALTRYNINGSLDSAFGNKGITISALVYDSAVPKAIAVQPDGRIIVVCNRSDKSIYGNDFDLRRYSADGILDKTFGVNGIVTTDFNQSADKACKIIIKQDGKILVGGYSLSNNNQSVLVLAQYNVNGSLDNTFGVGGKVATNTIMSANELSMAIQQNGKVIVACPTYINSTSKYGVSLTRFNTNGSIDSAFGTNGSVVQPVIGNGPVRATDISSDSTGKVVVLADAIEGNVIFYGYAFKFDSHGVLDNTFSDGGKLIIYLSEYFKLKSYNKMHVQPDGKIIFTGTAGNTNYDFLSLRYNSNGRLDSTFGKRGIIITDLGSKSDISYSSLIQPDGKVVMAGSSSDGTKTNITLARFTQNALSSYNTINGTVFFDNNKNGIKDPTEVFASNAIITSTKAMVDTTLTYTNKGEFSIDIDTGLYVTKANPYLRYYTVAPAEHTTTNTTYFNTDSVSFAIQPIAGKRDLLLRLIPIGVARPGFEAQYKIVYTNQGTDTITNGTIEFIKNNKLGFVSASPANSSVSGDTIRWNYSNLKPADTAGIILNLKVQAPPSVNNGDTLRSVASIYPSNTDLTPNDNTSVLTQRVVGSYDPNDKTESHAGSLKVAQVQQGEDLTYTIRFQNTGTDTAFNVYIRDTLSDKVDWSTLKMITSSHNFQLTVNDGNKCSWAFNNINLVDSNKNERLSHGYIVYSIKAKNTLTPGETIDNTAHIYFDYNLPVQTNTERTTVEAVALPLKLVTFTAKRSGKTNLLQWRTEREVSFDHFDIERSTDGTGFEKVGSVKGGLNTYSFTDNTPVNAINYYRLKMVDKDGKYEYSPVKTVDNLTGFYVSMYPNPATEKLIVQTDSEKEAAVQLQIIGMDGKSLLIKQGKVSAGQQLQTVDVSALQSGSYFLKVTTGAKEQTVIKFQKL